MQEILSLILLLMIYFTPYIVASSRHHNNTGSIFCLNFFLGWTLLGWVAALVWSFSNNVKPA